MVNGNPLTSPRRVAALLREHGLALSQRRGQNFLIDRNNLDKILRAADIRPGDSILEIGAGLGTLTVELCRRARKVVAVEWDRGLVEILRDQTGAFSNLEIIQGDILSVPDDVLERALGPKAASGSRKVVSNLPYSIASTLIIRLLECGLGFSSLVCMVQEEVGRRIVSPPGGKEYGILSVFSRMFSRPRIAFRVGKNCFFPPPRVESVVVVFDALPEPAGPVLDVEFWKSVVEAAFAHRRKILKNALVGGRALGYTPDQIEGACREAGINSKSRAERLSVQDFSRLANALAVLNHEDTKITKN